MKAALSLIGLSLSTLMSFTSSPAQAAELQCHVGSPITFEAHAAPWCTSGIELLLVETRCITSDSPAFSSMIAGRNYHGCVTPVLAHGGSTYEARVERVENAD